jgi:hypothetical protein
VHPIHKSPIATKQVSRGTARRRSRTAHRDRALSIQRHFAAPSRPVQWAICHSAILRTGSAVEPRALNRSVSAASGFNYAAFVARGSNHLVSAAPSFNQSFFVARGFNHGFAQLRNVELKQLVGAPAFMRGKERFSAPENASRSLKRFSAGTTPRLKRKKNSRLVFLVLRHGGRAEEIQPTGRYCRQDPCRWLSAAQTGQRDFDTAASRSRNPGAQRKATSRRLGSPFIS